MSSISSLVAQLIRPEIQALHAYHVPPSFGLIKLDAMENPYLVPRSIVIPIPIRKP
jgi:histidinol-phosphate aminotransferase